MIESKRGGAAVMSREDRINAGLRALDLFRKGDNMDCQMAREIKEELTRLVHTPRTPMRTNRG